MSSNDAGDGAMRMDSVAVVARPTYLSRFTLGQRYLHGVIMGTFIGLAFTGMVLRFSHSGWAHSLAIIVGGFTAILFWHKFCALTLTVAFLVHLGDVGYRGIFKGQRGLFWGPNSMVPRLKDFQDLYRHFRWFLWFGPRPEFDRFTYWEKFDYWAVFWGMAIIGISGYAMWFAPFFARFVPGSWMNVALLIHGEEALLAVWFIFTVHFFNTHLRPGSFPMDLVIFTGRVTEQELKEKHPVEYQRLVETGRLQAILRPAPERWLKNFGRTIGLVVIISGFVLLVLTLVTFFRGR
jgi:cytochrome b subunit of formate dehydrogenase